MSVFEGRGILVSFKLPKGKHGKALVDVEYSDTVDHLEILKVYEIDLFKWQEVKSYAYCENDFNGVFERAIYNDCKALADIKSGIAP